MNYKDEKTLEAAVDAATKMIGLWDRAQALEEIADLAQGRVDDDLLQAIRRAGEQCGEQALAEDRRGRALVAELSPLASAVLGEVLSSEHKRIKAEENDSLAKRLADIRAMDGWVDAWGDDLFFE